ncbi:hypothetical protein [Stieleria varia]|uniref:Uncharacterized protein n=1 Tax=Stieleria varia TaxID=2528005 RepID=A0A5C6B1G9_9BACT|nr:hypothetical protein [Stieleria varia]TWU05657.1 hypothetical protein Pla52n_13720 [Stieleria varia]
MAKPPTAFDADPRRLLALGFSILMLVGALMAYLFGSGNSAGFAAAGLGRVGIVMFALFLAWPSLRRPSQWLPAGAAMIGVVALIVIAANPRLAIAAIPAAGLLITVSAFARAFRRRDG